MSDVSKLNDAIKVLSDYCKSYDKCRKCPMDDMYVILHGYYEYACPLNAVMDTIRGEIHDKTE